MRRIRLKFLKSRKRVVVGAVFLVAGFSALFLLIGYDTEDFVYTSSYAIKSINSKEQRESVARVLASRLCRNHFETLLSLLDDLADALEAAGVTYFMSDGTLIGSWRHHGLIPWDDDVDLWFDGAHYFRAQAAFRRVPNSKIQHNSDYFVKLIREVPGYRPQNNFSRIKVSNSVSNSSETWTPSEVPIPFERLPRYGPEFWPDAECTRPHAEVDLFRFDDTFTGIRMISFYHIVIPRDAVFPLVLRPFERRISRVPVASVASGTRTKSFLSLQSTSRAPIVDLETWNAAPYRLLPAPRDPLRVLATTIYQKVEERCAKLDHWVSFGVKRDGWEVSCDELRAFAPFVWRVENATHYIELLRNRNTLISEFALPKTR